MLEELIEKLSFKSKRYIGGILGLIFGYIFVSYGLFSALIVMLTTLLGSILGDSENIKNIKKIILDRLKEE